MRVKGKHASQQQHTDIHPPDSSPVKVSCSCMIGQWYCEALDANSQGFANLLNIGISKLQKFPKFHQQRAETPTSYKNYCVTGSKAINDKPHL